MAGSRTSATRRWRWILGLAALAIPGFGLGMVAGLVWEEPGLVASYALGRTEEIGWGEATSGSELPAVASPSEIAEPAAAPPVPAPAKPGSKPAPPRQTARATPPKPAPAKKPAVAKSVPTAPKSGFAIQVGAFAERAGADRLSADLRSKGYRVYVSAGDSGAAWRVRVGPNATREEAERTAARLKQSEKLPTWVLEEDG